MIIQKRMLQNNIFHDIRHKNPQQNTDRLNLHGKNHVMTEFNLYQVLKAGSVFKIDHRNLPYQQAKEQLLIILIYA